MDVYSVSGIAMCNTDTDSGHPEAQPKGDFLSWRIESDSKHRWQLLL